MKQEVLPDATKFSQYHLWSLLPWNKQTNKKPLTLVKLLDLIISLQKQGWSRYMLNDNMKI